MILFVSNNKKEKVKEGKEGKDKETAISHSQSVNTIRRNDRDYLTKANLLGGKARKKILVYKEPPDADDRKQKLASWDKTKKFWTITDFQTKKQEDRLTPRELSDRLDAKTLFLPTAEEQNDFQVNVIFNERRRNKEDDGSERRQDDNAIQQ